MSYSLLSGPRRHFGIENTLDRVSRNKAARSTVSTLLWHIQFVEGPSLEAVHRLRQLVRFRQDRDQPLDNRPADVLRHPSIDRIPSKHLACLKVNANNIPDEIKGQFLFDEECSIN